MQKSYLKLQSDIKLDTWNFQGKENKNKFKNHLIPMPANSHYKLYVCYFMKVGVF